MDNEYFFKKVKEFTEEKILELIKSDWSNTDLIIYKTPEIKLASLLASKTKVIAKN